MPEPLSPHAGEPVPHRRPTPAPPDDGWGGGWASLPGGPAEESSPPTVRIPVQAPATAGRHEDRSPDEDSSGRALGMRFPSWDLLPPTEFVQRHRGR